MSTATDDLQRFFAEKINSLAEDLEWRCKAADLTQGDYHYIIAISLSHALANLMSATTEEDSDREFLSAFYRVLQTKRAERKAKESTNG